MNEQKKELQASEDMHPSHAARIDALNAQAWRLRYQNKTQAYQLSQQASNLSTSDGFAAQPYWQGVTSALLTSAFLYAGWGKLDLALKNAIEGLANLEKFPPSPIYIDCWVILCWIYIFYGDYPLAFDYALKALQLAHTLGTPDHEARVLDAIGSTYGFSGEFDSSIVSHTQALRIYQEIGDLEGEAISLNNLACSLFEMGNNDEAFTASQRSLVIVGRLNLLDEELVFTTTMADILVKAGKYAEAEDLLGQALPKVHRLENDSVLVNVLVSMARCFQAQGKYEEEEPFLLEALALAEKNDYKNDCITCHRFLSEVYERKRMPGAALQHYKQFFTLKEATLGAENTRKIEALKATYQLELSKKEAEIYRIHNQELQHEIEERKRVEAILEKLAIYDPLTNLFNRRQFDILSMKEIERSARYRRPLAMLMLDLDHFKDVNDLHGHLTGDRVLIRISAMIQQLLREADIVGRYGGEEFVVLMPETTADQAFEAAERLRQAISESRYESSAGAFTISISIGIGTGFEDALGEVHAVDLNDLLHQADQALYAAKRGGRNQSSLFHEN